MSRKDNPKTINVDGIDFPFPIDMYITRDRLMYEDYMRAKKLLQAIQEQLDKRQQYEKIPKHDPWKDWYPSIPDPQPQPYNPWWGHTRPTWKYEKTTSEDKTVQDTEFTCKSD